MYHRIGDPGSLPGKLTVAPQRFEEHLEAIARRFEVVSLASLIEGLRKGELRSGSVAVTFDDGYVDNLVQAKPLLERYGVPATVFVVSGYVDARKPFWWDELERICLAPPELPERLELTIGGKTRTWATPTDRRALYRELRTAFAPLDAEPREELLAELRTWSGAPQAGPAESMTPEELRRLADGGLVEVGAHTVSHPALPGLGERRRLEEIRGSRERLSSLLGREVNLFSYPFGEHDRRTADSVRAAGASCACTTTGDGVRASTDPFRLPRVYVGDWSADELVAAISARLDSRPRLATQP
jgi:peptidoglycan/xylan/chitin deacetylase (PgdA/CDA1 family)